MRVSIGLALALPLVVIAAALGWVLGRTALPALIALFAAVAGLAWRFRWAGRRVDAVLHTVELEDGKASQGTTSRAASSDSGTSPMADETDKECLLSSQKRS